MDVKAVREDVEWSQRELADWLCVSQATIARWESGTSSPSDEQAAALGNLRRQQRKVVKLDPYPSAPRGGSTGSREAGERLAWMNARNRMIQAGASGR